MNIMFFLTPKSEVAYIDFNSSLRQALEKMEYHRYTAVPVLDEEGHYIETITEGDILRTIVDQFDMSMQDAEAFPIKKVPARWTYHPVRIDCDIEDLVKTAMQQNFVPVVDDSEHFIGIITRSAIIQHVYEQQK